MNEAALEDILYEIWNILRVEKGVGRSPELADFQKLDERLQQVQRTVYQWQPFELAAWLRFTHVWSHDLPSWQPLFNTVYSHLRLILPLEIIEQDLLYGLFPR